MSVQDGLLAVLTLGPAYGSQLQGELALRAPHRARVNAGQIYSTLERLSGRGLVEAAGATDDGLPLYRLTAAGTRAARTWLGGQSGAVTADWTEMLDQVLVSASIPSGRPLVIIGLYEEAWDVVAVDPEPLSASVAAVTSARRLDASAALDWLAEMHSTLRADQRAFLVRRSTERPRRGRPKTSPDALAG